MDFGLAITPDHHHNVQYGTSSGSLNALFDSVYAGYDPIWVNRPLANANLGSSTTTFRLSVIDNLGVSDDNLAVSAFQLIYPRNFDLGSSSERTHL